MKHYRKSLLMACVLSSSLITAAGSAAAQDGWYGGVSGDLTWLRDSDIGGGGNIQLGKEMNNFRLEAEAGYHGAGGDSGHSGTHYFSYMGNLYYDFNTLIPSGSSGWHVSPYIGGGLGDAQVHYGSSGFANTFHHHSNNFAYEGMAGLNFVSSSMPNTQWSLGYRYLGTNNTNIESNNLELGVRFFF